MLRFHLVTLFQEACEPYLSASILGRAQVNKKIQVDFQNPRDFVDNKWGKVDERPYGGGPGMVMTALPVVKAVKKALGRRMPKASADKKKIAIIWFVPGAKPFTNAEADKLAKFNDVVLVCGRYEGIDERAAKILKTMGTMKTYSVGEATLTGGEVPALAITDAIARRLPGVLGKDDSVEERRTAAREVYTRPETITWEGKSYKVPKVLQTGHHANIDSWKAKKSRKT
ncbi:MAG: tRNA (guanosine(37)-N1)-methyltransferase TrmD [Candidatus Pacebacteria bacterium]|nr:tRNA (guanosine(37)-N1)-methyltransferase TrmD [Candidatus Paceibacterota bacterium]